ncbi:sulfotransferase domain-containing protein [Thermoleptolyngbya sp.]
MNVFHCCTPKTASQWVRSIFSDPRVQKFSGLSPYFYEEEALAKYGTQKLSERVFDKPFPDNTIITPLYADYSSFCKAKSMTKSQTFAFFVTRDPRDILISWYFSMKYSHPVIVDNILSIRNLLNSMSEKDGLRKSIHLLANFDLFMSIRSWAEAPLKDKSVATVKYEDLTAENNFEVFMNLFTNFGIDVPKSIMREVLEENRFEYLTGRKRGIQDLDSHFRKGIEGDWINFLDDELLGEFQNIVGDLPERLGYKTKDELFKQHISMYHDLAVQGFSELKKAKHKLKQSEDELRLTREELCGLKGTLQANEEQLIGLKHQLDLANARLNSLQSRIFKKNAKLHQIKTKLIVFKEQFHRVNRELLKANRTINDIKQSRLWNFYILWGRLKGSKFFGEM